MIPASAAGPSLREDVLGRQLVVVTGKGGVGKSTLSGTLGKLLLVERHRVLLLEVDPRESLHQMLGVAPSGGGIVKVEPGLYLQNLPARRVMDGIVRERLRIEALVRKVLDSPVYRHFADGAPGLKELAVLVHAWRLASGASGRRAPRVDTVVLDAPASGHGVSLLAAPSLAGEVIHSGPFARMAHDLTELITDRTRSAIVAVTTAEEMPVQEVVELAEMLRGGVGRTPEGVLVNGLYPPCPPAHHNAEGLELWCRRREANEHELDRLRRHYEGPVYELPLLPLDRGPALLAALGRALRETAAWA
jgi:anion-transporting  ArsA/GET3 family ATPase